MTGDSQSNDDTDLFDDDFVVEETLGTTGDIGEQFGEAAVPAGSSKGVDATEELSLDEDSSADDCRGHRHIESVGVPESTLDSEAEAADPRILDAKKNFATELDALLQEEAGFGADSGLGLDSEVDDGVTESLDLGPFVLEDDAGLCSEEFDAEVSCDGAVAELQGEDVFVHVKAGPLTLDDDVASLFSLDGKAESVALVKSLWGRFGGRLLVAVAATFLVVGGVATTILHPAWLGMSREPERLAKMAVGRPQVVVAVVEPPALLVASEGAPNGAHSSVNKTGAKNEQPVTVPQTLADLGEISPDPKSANPAEPGTPKVAPTEALADVNVPNEGMVASRQDSADGRIFGLQPLGANDKVDVSHGAVVIAEQGVSPMVDSVPLMRFGDDLFVGDEKREDFSGRVIDGVMPGNRAFAQLRNGNYFVGRVKHVAEEAVTLRVNDGEVTLLMDDIAKLTRLGSADYADLQKTTKGFVRLTNNNRLAGGILSRIAGDHVVVEFRSNRVMLPKSAVDEVVTQDGEAGNVRLGTTIAEEGFIRNLAKRQLGSGQGSPGPVGDRKPAVGGSQHR